VLNKTLVMLGFLRPHTLGKLTPPIPLSVKWSLGHIWSLGLHTLDKLMLHIYLKLWMEPSSHIAFLSWIS